MAARINYCDFCMLYLKEIVDVLRYIIMLSFRYDKIFTSTLKSLFLPLREDAIIEIIRTMNNQSVDSPTAPSKITKQIICIW